MSVRRAAVRLCLFGFAVMASLAVSAHSTTGRVHQAVRKSSVAKDEAVRRRFATEPYVVERHFTNVRFENDGTETRELSVRVRIQSDAGAQQFRNLSFNFVSPNEEVSLRSATIREPNGSVLDILSRPNATKVLASSIAKSFPAYTALKDLQVAVPPLQSGDTLDYDIVVRATKPSTPGEFWFSYDFPRDAVVLDDRLELNLPSGRAFSIKAPEFSRRNGIEKRSSPAQPDANDFAFTRTDEGGRTILRWRHANLKRASDDQNSPAARASKAPDVEITSFRNWADVARWYTQFERNSSDITPQIRSKVQELSRGAATDRDKAEAICKYVSQQIRNVELPGEFGQLAPRAAQDVLATGYGDSTEKNALLAAMLNAAGIHSSSALTAYEHKVDPNFPSPTQFDHVITAIRDGATPVWIDASAQFAPFGFLPAPLRGQSALLIGSNGSANIAETPVDPPFLATQRVEVDAQISELGKLSATVRYSLRGDTEYVLRTAFHRAPRAQWNSLAQTILTLDGLRGQVTNVNTSDPFDTAKPFQLTIAFSNPGAFTWPMERAKIALPLLTIGLPDPPAKSGEPIKLGTPLDVETHLRLRLPPTFNITAPVGTALTRDYAEFKSSYRVENGTLIAERVLNFKMPELPASREPDYLAFAHAVQSDASQALFIANAAGAKAVIPSDATADDLVDAGTAALKIGDARSAILLLQRATQIAPNHKTAWNELGLSYMQAHEFTDAAAAFQKQAQLNPSDDRVHDYLGVALEQLHRDDDAATAFQEQIARQPLDPVAHAQLGSILLRQERYSDAVPELEKATILSPDNAELEILLGRAYLNIGDKDKGLASFRKAIKLSPGAQIRNEVAYTLAQQGTDLDRAQQYAESAIRATASSLNKADIVHLTSANLTQTADIGAYWDTLGWIYFRQGDLARAKRYISAAWMLTQNGEVGDHLAQIYTKSGEKQRAIHQCALALATSDPVPDTRPRLMLLLGGNAQIDGLVNRARAEAEKARTFVLKLPVNVKASAGFLIVISPGGTTSLSARVDAVRFTSGDESLRRFADDLKSLNYGEVFPDATRLKLIRRGTLSCSPTGECRFALVAAEVGAPN
jgi:tetratricopeptide (TPR) repeat protein/transglutaminase-like putative cysteine protease